MVRLTIAAGEASIEKNIDANSRMLQRHQLRSEFAEQAHYDDVLFSPRKPWDTL